MESLQWPDERVNGLLQSPFDSAATTLVPPILERIHLIPNARRRSIPMLVWLVAGLVLVALLPVVAGYFQLQRNISSIVEQTQRTHQIFAQASADRLGAQVRSLDDLIVTAGRDRDIYIDPAAEAASARLAELASDLGGNAVVELRFRTSDGDRLFFAARPAGSSLSAADFADPSRLDAPGRVVSDGAVQYLRLQRETDRPQLFLIALIPLREMMPALATGALGDDASLALIDSSANIVAGNRLAFDQIPAEARSTLLTRFPAGSQSFRQGQLPVVFGFQSVGGTDLKVVSMQPAASAEIARSQMNETALWTLAGIAVAVALLSTGAWYLVVAPIRRLITSVSSGYSGGGEIAQLQSAFARLKGAIADRDAFQRVFLARYQVKRLIGSGAMGTVYEGWDPSLKRSLALKTIRLDGDIASDEHREATRELLTEASTSARLIHPNIVTIYDVMGDERGAFIAMELVDGHSLDRQVNLYGPMDGGDLRRMALHCLLALEVAHDESIIHRDIKPANIIQTVNGDFKITDFGIAARTQQSLHDRVIMGTPGFIAPETYRTGKVSPRTDLFALGVTLLECATGIVVFGGRNTAQIIARTQARQITLRPELRSRIGSRLANLIEALLAKEPEDRPQSARAAALILEEDDSHRELNGATDDGEKRRSENPSSRSARTRRIVRPDD